MDSKLIVIFGQPGAGKSYVAQILADQFGYFSYNGDEALPPDMKKKILEKSDVTRDMRTRFVGNIITQINRLTETKNKIVLHQALIKKHMREQLKKSYPYAFFLWVYCDDTILKKRYMKRCYFNLGLAYLQIMINAFEAPEDLHARISNTIDGPDEVTRQLREIGI